MRLRDEKRHADPYHVAVAFIVGMPAAFAIHGSMPAFASLALRLNSAPSNSGLTPR
jgi:hypothetical protein